VWGLGVCVSVRCVVCGGVWEMCVCVCGVCGWVVCVCGVCICVCVGVCVCGVFVCVCEEIGVSIRRRVLLKLGWGRGDKGQCLTYRSLLSSQKGDALVVSIS